MIIRLDWDGVVVDTGKLKALLARRYFGVEIPVKQCKAELVGQFLTVREYRALTLLVSHAEHGLDVEPVPGALEHIRMLQRDAHEMGIATSRDGEFLKVSKLWARRNHLSGLMFQGAGYQMSKAEILRGVDIFADDDLEKLKDLEDVVRYRVLFSQPYNLDDVVPEGIVRVNDWPDFYRYIKDLTRSPFPVIDERAVAGSR